MLVTHYGKFNILNDEIIERIFTSKEKTKNYLKVEQRLQFFMVLGENYKSKNFESKKIS